MNKPGYYFNRRSSAMSVPQALSALLVLWSARPARGGFCGVPPPGLLQYCDIRCSTQPAHPPSKPFSRPRLDHAKCLISFQTGVISYPVYSLSEELDPDALIEMDRQAEKLASSLFFRGP